MYTNVITYTFVNISREHILARPEVEAMRLRQLSLEDTRRELNFAIRNLDDARSSRDLDFHQQRLESFLAAKKSLGSMAARFALSMRPEYHNVTIAEIGATTEAQCPRAIDTLKDEYRELLGSLVETETIDGEFSREDPLAHRALSLVDRDGAYAILARTRALTVGTTEAGQRFALGKRMVFALPVGAWNAVEVRSEKAEQPKIEIVEQMLDQNDKNIVPIRTAYYRLRGRDSE